MSRGTQRFTSLPMIVGWIVPFGLVVYLSLEGGGYDLVPRSAVAMGIWLALAVGVAAGLLPRAQPSRRSLIALGLLAGLAVWWALAMIWSESAEDTFNEVARILFYLGAFALALAIQGPGATRRTLTAVGAAITVVAALAVLSRLHPQWFPADQLAQVRSGEQERLNYPLNYWNGDGALFAMGIPLLLAVAETSRRLLVKGLATAAIPLLALGVFYTFSRAGEVAAALAIVAFLALHPRRLEALPTVGLGAFGSMLLILAATQRDALESNLGNGLAHSEGGEMIAIVVILCAGVALLRVAAELVLRKRTLPTIGITRRAAAVTAVMLACVGLAGAVAAGAPSKVEQGWEDFKSPGVAGNAGSRLTSTGGNGRYQYWSSAVDAAESEPVTGIGPGTFQYWWTRHATMPGFILNAHSLYLETFAEGGIVGLALILGLIGFILVAGARRLLGADPERRVLFSAILIAEAVFACIAGEDWLWQIPVLPVTFFILAAALLGGTEPEREPEDATARSVQRIPVRWRAAVGAAAVVAILVSANVLASTQLISDSQADVRANNLPAAVDKAETAESLQPWAASPPLQDGLVLQLQGNLDAAAAKVSEATDHQPTNWRVWYALSGIEDQRGDGEATDQAYDKARSLNPTDWRFQQQGQ